MFPNITTRWGSSFQIMSLWGHFSSKSQQASCSAVFINLDFFPTLHMFEVKITHIISQVCFQFKTSCLRSKTRRSECLITILGQENRSFIGVRNNFSTLSKEALKFCTDQNTHKKCSQKLDLKFKINITRTSLKQAVEHEMNPELVMKYSSVYELK